MKKLGLILILIMILLTSCTTSKPKSFYRVVTVPAHTIHFCSDRSMFAENPMYQLNGRKIDGFYDPNSQSIWILAFWKDGKIWPWSECLTYVDCDIGNPDND